MNSGFSDLFIPKIIKYFVLFIEDEKCTGGGVTTTPPLPRQHHHICKYRNVSVNHF